MPIKICHITTVHTRHDIRIFQKQCKSLSNEYDVFLIVADGLGDENLDNVSIVDVGKRQTSRLKRALNDSKKVFKKAKELNCELYHFHDPELMSIGLKLLRTGKKVIYDVHEDLPRQIMGKPYLNKILKPIISILLEIYENYAAKKFTSIITATPHIKERFYKRNKNTLDINNYPIVNELLKEASQKEKKNQVCYLGGISKIRGIENVILSMKYTDVNLALAGDFENNELYESVKSLETWNKIIELGFISREQAADLLSESIAGIVCFLPLPNHINAQPNKIFEYMSAGLPVIGSNFKLWKQIIEDNNCGLCVDPSKPKEIAEGINKLFNNKDLAIKMGQNGIHAVKEKYNWNIEKNKLLDFYNRVLNN